MLAGNVVALLSPLIFVPVLTYAFGPQNYDYKSMAAIRLGNDEDIANANNTDLELIPGAIGLSEEEAVAEQKKLQRASLVAKSLTGFMTLALLILWPMPMYGTGYIFSKKVCLTLSFFSFTCHVFLGNRNVLGNFYRQHHRSFRRDMIDTDYIESSLPAGSSWVSYGCSSAVSASGFSHCGRADIVWPIRSRVSLGI